MRLRAFLVVLAVMWIIPIPVYGGFAAAGWMTLPESGSSTSFLLGVSLIKAGFAYGFVAFFPGEDEWIGYAARWWLMFAILEAGQVVMGMNSLSFAVAGVLSEAAYFPVASRATARFLSHGPGSHDRTGP